MEITELKSLTDSQLSDIQALLKELSPRISVTTEWLAEAVQSPNTHLFVAINENGNIAGCATLCVFDTLECRRASVEDVVVLSSYRGQHIGKHLMEYVMEYAQRELKLVDLQLTSSSSRAIANELYQSLGFAKRDTNFFTMRVE